MARVALIGENSKEYVNALIDIWNEGDCAVLLDWRIPFPSLLAMMEEANVRRCVVEEAYFEKYETASLDSIEFTTYKAESKTAEKLPDYVYEKFSPSYSKDEALIIYSSGTTGNAKGIILSHFAININADAIIDYMRPRENDCLYIVKPFSHSSSITGELLVALKSHISLVVSPTIVPPRYVFRAINDFKVSILCINPTLLSIYSDSCSQRDPNLISLSKIYVSGSILKSQILEKARKLFKNIAIYNVYGLSEAGPRVAAQQPNCNNGNSVGRAISGVRIKIVDENGQTVDNGEAGLIHVNTPSIFSGYVSGNKALPSKYEGWLNTGDIGYFDDKNELHIIGRADDVIILGTHKIYPSQVEQLVMESGNIRECIVVMANHPSGKEILCCLYVSPNDLQADIKKHLNKHLIRHEIPQVFINVENLPKTPNGKVSAKMATSLITKLLYGGMSDDQRTN